MELSPCDWSTGAGGFLHTQFLATLGWSRTIGRAVSAGWSLSKEALLFPCEDAQCSFPTGGFTSQSVTDRADSASKSEQRSHGMDLVRTCSLAQTALDHGSNLPTLMPSRTSGT